jgi:hypothetical protein
MILYDAHENMSAQLGCRDRTRFAVGDQLRGSSEEIKAAFESYNAYWGRYEVDEPARQQAMFPNWTGSERVRNYKLEDNKLILVLVWERVR